MKKIIKKVLRINFIQSFLGWIISLYLKFCYHTSSWISKGEENVQELILKKKNFIVCFWHGRLLMTPFCWKYNKDFFMLISDHPDGRLISNAVNHFQIKTIVGSSSKKKLKSLKEILKEIRKKNIIGITPDGPRGPKYKFKSGIVSISKLTNIPIIPLSYGSKYNFELNSWDNFLLATPFNSYLSVWGKPVRWDKNDSNKTFKKKIEDELNRVTKLSNCLEN